MTTPHLIASLRHVIEAATLAPSVHNTQPWRFVLREDGFDLLADSQRQLPVLDPSGRLMHLSCGAALVTARVAARALGLAASVELLPDPGRPDLLARVTLTSGAPADDAELALALAVLKRHTARTPFLPVPLPSALLRTLEWMAEQEGASLHVVVDEADLLSLAVLLSGADRQQERDPEYRKEIASWVRLSPLGDGIPPAAVEDDPAQSSTLRLRDFTMTHPERRTDPAPAAEPAVVVLTTHQDGPEAWLRAGQAMGAVLLHAAAEGVQAQPLGQVTDLPAPRAALTRSLGLAGVPQLVLRLGRVEVHAGTPRRDLSEVVVLA